MIEVTVPAADKLESALDIKRVALLMALKSEIKKIAIDLTAKVKGEKLSGQVLNVRSGRLRRSINYRIEESDTGIDAKVGTNVEYGRVHEFGFKGAVNVKEHMRAGKQKVRAHKRRMNLPERSFLRSSLREMQPDIESRIARAIGRAIAGGAR